MKSNTTLAELNLDGEDERRHTRTSINNSFFSFLFSNTGNFIGDTGATSLSESLKSNTTLMKLYLSGEDRRRHTKGIHQQFTLFLIITSTANKIGEIGTTYLSESLKSNTTLTELYLRSEDKKKEDTKDIHKQFTLFLIITSTGNKIRDTGATSLSESLKSNTTLTELYLSSEDKKKEDTQETSINNSLFSLSSLQQVTRLETQGQHH